MDLQKGKLYFWTTFHESDPKLEMPHIHSLIYLGKNIFPEDEQENKSFHYFQELGSFQEHGSLLDFPENEEIETYCFGEDCISDIKDLPHLIKKLERLQKYGNLSRIP